MKNNQNFWGKIGKSIKNLFIRLFGFGRAKNELDDELLENIKKSNQSSKLNEEEMMSPTKRIFKKFIRNKVAIVGLVVFIGIILFLIIGGNVIKFDASYMEGSQQYIEPKTGYLNVPRKLQKSGVKVTTDNYGVEQHLIGVGNAFTVAISNDNEIFVWGANVEGIRNVPEEVKEKAGDIVQLSVGMRHAIVLTKDGNLLGWGSNGFEQAQKPVYNSNIDSSYPHKKAIQAYFDPSVRSLYKSEMATTIEEDPIKKIVAGPQTTSILTESGRVYNWGITKTIGSSDAEKSYNYLEILFRVTDTHLQWRYLSEINANYRDIKSIEDIKTQYGIVDVEGKTIEFSYNTSGLRWRYEDEGDWIVLATRAELLELIPEATARKIVDIYQMPEHIIYEFNDNSFVIIGVENAAKNDAPDYLEKSAEERGFSVLDIKGTLKNIFLLTDKNEVFGWGTYNTSNMINDIPEEVSSRKIVQIDTGSYHVIARDIDGNVYTWGSSNDLNQLNIPKKMDSSEFIVSNYFNSLSINEDGEAIAWGNKGYIFGTNYVGADNFKRIIKGGTLTISLAAIAVVVSLVIGLIVGLIAGFYGGWIDNLLMRFGEIVNAFPFLPLAMTLAVLVTDMGLSDTDRMVFIMIVLGLLSWPGLARLIRGQILAEREKDFVLAAKALGIKEKHIITRHILPNVINVVIVNTTLSYAGSLLTESGLSFLGFGVKYPQPSWGNMLTGAQSMTVLKYYWWVWIIPAVFIILTALSVNLIGDGLRDAMDPKSNER